MTAMTGSGTNRTASAGTNNPAGAGADNPAGAGTRSSSRSKLWTLFWTVFRSTYGISVLKWRYLKRRERLWEPVLILWGIGTLVVVFGFGLYRTALAIAQVGAPFGQSSLALGMGAAAVIGLTLLFGFFYILSFFYFARDNSILVPLPLKPGTIVLARFFVVLAGEYVTALFAFGPAVAGYAGVAGFSAGKALVSALVFLLLPVTPLAVSGLVAMVLMRLVNRRHRDIYMVIFSIALLVVIFGFQTFIVRSDSSDDPERFLMELVTARFGLVRSVTRNLPPAFWAAVAIDTWPSAQSLLNLALLVVTSGVALVVLRWVGEVLFYRGLIGGEELPRGARPRAASRGTAFRRALGNGETLYAQSSPSAALGWREWTLFMRTPIWVLNGLLPGLIAPFALVMPLIARGGVAGLLAQFNTPVTRLYAGLAFSALFTFMGSVNSIASTAVSREGRRYWISRTMPQDPAKQVQAKLVISSLLLVLSMLPSVIAYIVVLKPPVMGAVLPIVIGLLGALSGMAVGLRLDVARPMLQWDDPQEPVKRNLNAIFPIGFALAYFAVGVFLVIGWIKLKWDPARIYAAALVIAAVVAAVSVSGLRGAARAAYARIEQ